MPSAALLPGPQSPAGPHGDHGSLGALPQGAVGLYGAGNDNLDAGGKTVLQKLREEDVGDMHGAAMKLRQREIVDMSIVLLKNGAHPPEDGGRVGRGKEACDRCLRENSDAVAADVIRRAYGGKYGNTISDYLFLGQ